MQNRLNSVKMPTASLKIRTEMVQSQKQNSGTFKLGSVENDWLKKPNQSENP